MEGSNALLPKMYRGVTKIEDDRYEAHTFSEGAVKRIGVYDSDIEAALAYDAVAEASMGEFAVLNFPDLTSEDSALKA